MIIFVWLLVLSYFSAPAPLPDMFVPKVAAMFPFGIAMVFVAPNGHNETATIGGGMVRFNANGSISAGNTISVNITVFINNTLFKREPKSIVVTLIGAFLQPPEFDIHGLTGYIGISLAKTGDLWWGDFQVRYIQGGSLPIEVTLDNLPSIVGGFVEMGSQDVTVATRTNSLVISLTWAILAFAVLELRVDSYHHRSNKRNTNNKVI